MRRETGSKKKGFTLVEVIVTLTILGILAAIAIPTGIHYMEKARQTARDKVARSVFLAAQKALTSKVSSGNSLPVLAGNKVNVGKIDPPYKDIEENKANIVYLSLNQESSDKTGKELYQLLDTYLADAEILDNTVLVEFNKKTGKVYSAFYSEVVPSIGYDSGAYNAYKRSEQDRKDGKMGYWGVDSTGKSEETDLDADANIQLVDYDVPNKEFSAEEEVKDSKGNNINDGENYGLLTVECLLPEDMLSVEKLTIELKGVGQSESIQIVNDDSQSGSGEGISYTKIKEKGSLQNAVNYPFKVGDALYQMYIEKRTSDGRDILVLILDGPLSTLSITKNHEALGTGEIEASMIVEKASSNKTYFAKEKAHALFGEMKNQDGKTAYAISSVRHLNNIRYVPSAKDGEKTTEAKNAVFVQTENVYCRNYDGKPLLWQPIGVQGPTDTYPRGYTNNEKKYTWGKTNGFAGTYMGEKKTIYDLTIFGEDKNYGFVGLFSCLSADSRVEGIELDYTSAYEGEYNEANVNQFFIRGKDRVGGIAGENWGIIAQCTVQGNFFGYKGEARVGAIVGKNMWDRTEKESGLVTQSVAVANVSASSTSNADEGACAGGIVGDNYGAITYCESGTATSRLQGSDSPLVRHIDGTPYFGVTMENTMGFRGKYENSVNDVVTIKAAKCAGGIAGQNRASQWGKAALIQYCVNAANVITNDTTGNNDAKPGAGGIVGRYCRFSNTVGGENIQTGTRISHCYNAGSVTGSVYAGGIAGTYKVNGDTKAGADNLIESCYNTGTITNGTAQSRAGGVVGCIGPYTSLSNSYNVGNVGKDKHDSEAADGIFYAKVNSTSTYRGCAARKNKDPNHWEKGNIEDLERVFLGPGQLKDKSFEGLETTKNEVVGIFDYPYPHFNVENASCKLGDYFHRTQYDKSWEE